MVEPDAKQAAVEAGYSERTTKQQGHRLTKNDEIRAEIARCNTAIAERADIDAAWVLTQAVEVVERCMQVTPVRSRTCEIVEGKWQFDAAGAIRALTLIAKHTGGFNDKVEHTGPGGRPLLLLVEGRFRGSGCAARQRARVQSGG